MTKEQEEAIENLTKLLKQRNEKQVKITTYNLFENIETVLNMLKEKDEKIAKYEKIYKEYDCYRWVKELEKKIPNLFSFQVEPFSSSILVFTAAPSA